LPQKTHQACKGAIISHIVKTLYANKESEVIKQTAINEIL